MCQPAPLPRCSDHTKKERASLVEQNDQNNSDIRELESKISDIDPRSKPEVLKEREALRGEYRTALAKKRSLESELREKQLYLDSTPKGRKALEENSSVPNHAHRLANAQNLNDWHKKMRNATDSDGNKYVAGQANLEEQHNFYANELKSAQNELHKEQTELKMYHERYKAPSPFLTDHKPSPQGTPEDEKQRRQNAVASIYRATAIRARASLLSTALKDTEKKQIKVDNKAKVDNMKSSVDNLSREVDAIESERTLLGKSPSNEYARLRHGAKAEVLKESINQLKVRQDKPEELEKFRDETKRRRAIAITERDNRRALPDEKNLAIGAVAAYDMVLYSTDYKARSKNSEDY